MLRKKWISVLFATGMFALSTGISSAADWDVSVGGALFQAPAFKGSDDYQVFVAPTINVSYQGGMYTLSPIDGLSARIVNSGGFSSRLHLEYDSGRRENNNSSLRIGGGRSHALQGLGNVSETALIGASMQYNFDPIVVSLKASQATGSHEGLTVDGRLAYSTHLNSGARFSLGGKMEWASSDYQQAYFGIDAVQSRNSGLRQFNASSGIVSYGVFSAYSYPLSTSWTWMAMGGYDRLQGDAADSPLVKERGSVNQYMLGTGVNYSF